MTRLQDERLQALIEARIARALELDRAYPAAQDRWCDGLDAVESREASIAREVEAQVRREVDPDLPEEGYLYC